MAKKPTAAEIKQRARRLALAYEHVFTTPEGQLVLEDLQNRFMRRSSVTLVDGKVDPHRTLVNEGARELVLYIEQKVIGGGNARMDGDSPGGDAE